MIGQLSAVFKSEENHRRRFVAKNRRLAVAARSRVRFVEQMRAQVEQIESVRRPIKTCGGGFAQLDRFWWGEKFFHGMFVVRAGGDLV